MELSLKRKEAFTRKKKRRRGMDGTFQSIEKRQSSMEVHMIGVQSEQTLFSIMITNQFARL